MLTGHTNSVSSICVSGNKIISGSQDRTIKIWNRQDGSLHLTLTGHTLGVTSVCAWASSDGA